MTTLPINHHLSRPVPQFFNDNSILATKKERFSSTPKVCRPPRPPSKSITQYSRLSFTLNNSKNSHKAQIITFQRSDPPCLSHLYDDSLKKSYLKQCFVIEEKIGSGSFGDVFRVKSLDDQRYYAVKVSREKFKGKVDRDEKLNEVCKHEQLPTHDHLVKLYCAWEERQRLYIQTELCSMSLSTLAENNHEIPEKTVWAYLIDLLKAINHLHSYNLIHLDIKPENIFITHDGLCKLGDFGLIFDINNHQYKEATEGDPKYLANEVMQGVFTKSADIFSLGMTILELASDLDLPSRGQSWHMLRSGDFPEHIFSKMSNDLRTIITLMLNPNHNLRPTAHDLLSHPIVCKYEKQRRTELLRKKSFSFIQDKAQLLKQSILNNDGFIYFVFTNLTRFISMILLPLRNVLAKMISSSRNQNEDSNHLRHNFSPTGYNRTHVSHYLDQYSDDEETADTRFASNLSFDMSFSSDDEVICENLSSRNLCSTVNRTNNSLNRFVMPQLSPLVQESAGGDDYYENSLKSVTQRLTFDEFSSDEMEMSEEEEEDSSVSQPNSSHNNSSTDNTSQSNLRLKQNISRKNLMKTFDKMNGSDL